ncbi:MAG: cytochrome c oxidase subunit II, partial [Chloroflexi bacterium]
MSPLLPAGPAAARIADLTYVIFGLAAVVFIVVESLLLFAVLRFRRAQVSGEPKQIYGNAPLEAVWTAVPALIL